MQKEFLNGKNLTQQEFETGGYSDIDVLYARKLKQQQAQNQQQELDDDQLDDLFGDQKDDDEENEVADFISGSD